MDVWAEWDSLRTRTRSDVKPRPLLRKREIKTTTRTRCSNSYVCHAAVWPGPDCWRVLDSWAVTIQRWASDAPKIAAHCASGYAAAPADTLRRLIDRFAFAAHLRGAEPWRQASISAPRQVKNASAGAVMWKTAQYELWSEVWGSSEDLKTFSGSDEGGAAPQPKVPKVCREITTSSCRPSNFITGEGFIGVGVSLWHCCCFVLGYSAKLS